MMDVKAARNQVQAALEEIGFEVDPAHAGQERMRLPDHDPEIYVEIGTSMNEVRTRFYRRRRLVGIFDVNSERHMKEDLLAIQSEGRRLKS